MERPWQDKDTLVELYVEEGLTTTEIGEKLDCGEGTVWRWLDKHDIPRRNRGPKRTHTELSDPDWLREQYVDEKKTAYEIAQELGCSDVNVYYWMNKHGLETRSEHNGQLLADERLADKSWLREKHYDDQWSYRKIASECGVHPSSVQQWMERHGLEYQAKKEDYYGPNWDEQREARLDRDGWECVVCGMTNAEHEKEYNRELNVHHIRPLRKFRDGDSIDFEAANAIENLITLCGPCHHKWEGVPVKPET
jgi:transposase-like protein